MPVKELLLARINGVINMTKEEVRSKILEADDAIVTYRSQNSNKLKYNVVTLNLNCEYLKAKRCKALESKDTVVVFSWDTDSFKILKPNSITHIVPLSNMLRSRCD